jgi:hypothetical protein
VRGCGARSTARAADGVSSARAAERDGAYTPRLSRATDILEERDGFQDFVDDVAARGGC